MKKHAQEKASVLQKTFFQCFSHKTFLKLSTKGWVLAPPLYLPLKLMYFSRDWTTIDNYDLYMGVIHVILLDIHTVEVGVGEKSEEG